MIKIKEAIIVEGKYDKIKLSSILDAVIIVTDGFQIYKDKEKLSLIRHYAETTGIIILTDSDRAGFKIRSFIKGAVKNGKVYNVYAISFISTKSGFPLFLLIKNLTVFVSTITIEPVSVTENFTSSNFLNQTA